MLSQLTPEQQKAITFLPNRSQTTNNELPEFAEIYIKKNLIIEAGAGAGKTKVLSERVKWILSDAPKSQRLNPNQIILVTFTNDAQKELKERIENILSENGLNHFKNWLHISTIDSLFDSLVECIFPSWWENTFKEKQLKTVPPTLTLIPEMQVQKKLEKKVLQFLNEHTYDKNALSRIIDFILSGGFKKKQSHFYSPAQTLENILKCMLQDSFLNAKKEEIRVVAKNVHPATYPLISSLHSIARLEYEQRIKSGQFTFADKTVFLKENLRQNVPIVVKELIVDEYQDTNKLQHDILYNLVECSQGRMIVVGDPKQSIYGFRGASVNIFKSLLKNDQWEHIILNKNFRTNKPCLQEINTLSSILFSWQDPRLPDVYLNSFFHKEATKKQIGENPLIPGKLLANELIHLTEKPSLYIVTTSLYQNKKKEKSDNDSGLAIQQSSANNASNINNLSLYAYAEFLKEFKKKENVNWHDIVILCEKNKQIKMIKDTFVLLGIPVKTTDDLDRNTNYSLPEHAGLSLMNCLLGRADSFDLYLLLMSPLLEAGEEDIFCFLAAIKKYDNFGDITKFGINYEKPLINHLFILFEEYRKIASYNFFYAWQKLRWHLAKINNKNKSAFCFCAAMDPFARALFSELANSTTRQQMELCAAGTPTIDFTIPETLDAFLITKQDLSIPNQEDAIEIKTVHKAKGLEWPIVCFFPKYGIQFHSGEFISTKSEHTLDISWLSQDVEGLSIVKRIKNINFNDEDSYINENQKIIQFSEIRKHQEDNYERQRVFYTAITRPQKTLVLFQPMLHHNSKKGLKDLALEKKKPSFYDYLEQDLFVKYITSHFDLQNPHSTADFIEIYYSKSNNAVLTHYQLSKFL